MDCPNDRYVNDAAICQAVVGMLARIGVKVDLLAQPKAQYFAKVLKPGGYKTSFYHARLDAGLAWIRTTCCTTSWAAATTRRTRRRGEANLGGYCNKEFDALTDKVLVETDTGQARPADQAGLRDRHQGLRLHPAAPAGAGLGRVEQGQADPARRQPGPAVLGDEERRIGNGHPEVPRSDTAFRELFHFQVSARC